MSANICKKSAPAFQDEIVSIHNLKILETVVQQGSFAKAAYEMNLTPSAVSHAISKLEKNFGLLLFMRTNKGMTLTPAGEHILPYIRSVQHSNELLFQEINQIHDLLLGTVGIAAFHHIAVQWMPQIIHGFQKKYPNIEVKIYQSDYYRTLDWIKDGTVDLAFVAGEVPKAAESFPVFRDHLVCITPDDFVPAHKDYVSFDDLKTMNLVFQRGGYNIEVQAFLENNHLRTDSSHYLETSEALVASVESGFGCCVLPAMATYHPQARVRVYPIVPKEEYTIHLIAAHPLETTPATREMCNYIIQHLQQQNSSGGER
ncbi:MAG: LysR family transcriptional regulator [Peptococcaceae bacterium]|jgi:DNA-binding transcriptional LysR family regulator|nr:LysR family transcriptional regulator [Peptococcaceae bacterium]